MSSSSVKAQLTPKLDKTPHQVKVKVFWKTEKKWTNADVEGLRHSVGGLAEKIKNEKYWTRDGEIQKTRVTCEDFAIRLLVEYASNKGLPVKLTTGVRSYRNVEIYEASDHDRYDSSKYGFSEMVMLTFGARDIQRAGQNTLLVQGPDKVAPGDILALARDLKGQASGNAAHHIQVVVDRSANHIQIYQGNSDGSIHRPITWINKLFGRNSADPQQGAYAGMPVELGQFVKNGKVWDYENKTTGSHTKDFLKYFEMYRWNYEEFNN